MLLLIDNYDSFTWNLVQRLGEIEPRLNVEVYRNDSIDGDAIAAKQPSHLLISPGPCTPDKAGISCDVVRRFAGRMPILGVCLGHQAVGQVFGGEIVAAKQLMHGKVDQIEHAGRGLFAGLSSPIEATRYHSLVIDPASVPDVFEVDAWGASIDRFFQGCCCSQSVKNQPGAGSCSRAGHGSCNCQLSPKGTVARGLEP